MVTFGLVLPHIFDVFIGLILRVYHKGPSPRFVDDDSVFYAGIVFRESGYIPHLDLHGLAQI